MTGSGASSSRSVSDWLRSQLHGVTGGRVRDIVPSIYDAYVRILHPVHEASGSRIRWSDLAEVAAVVVRPGLQWEQLIEAFGRTGHDLALVPPEPGCLDPDSMEEFVDVVHSTGGAGHCFAGVWDGWAWLDDARLPGSVVGSVPTAHRTYVLLEGSLRELASFDAGLIGARSPNLLWPADGSWFLASEVDLDSSILGGRRELCEAVLASSEIEAWSIGPDYSLSLPG
jgi:hypothetical protein